MKNKLICVFVLAFFIISFFAGCFVLAEEIAIPSTPISPETIENTILTGETKWDYLSRHWKVVLLQNSVIKALNTAFTALDKIGFFIVLFGVHWDLGFAVIFSIILWIFLLFYIKKQLHKSYANLDNFYSYLAALGLVIILAQFKILYKIGQTVFELFTTTKGKFILFVAFLIIFILLSIVHQYGKRKQKSREKQEKTELHQKVEKHEKFYQGVEEGRNLD